MPQQLFAGIERFDDEIALICPNGNTVTYSELAQMADTAAKPLGSARVLALAEMANAIEPIAFYIGALRAGHAVIPTSGGDAAIAIAETFAPGASFTKSEHGWILQKNSHSAGLHPDLAVLLSTSGSTGSPKLVRLSHRNLLSNAEAISEYLELQAGERAITSLPPYYSYGLSVLHSHLLFGHAIVLSDHSIAEQAFWDTVLREKVTSFAGVPHSFELLLRSGLHEHDYPSLRYFTQAGGKLPSGRVREIAQWAGRTGKRFYVMYGQTEAAPRMAYLPPADAFEYADTIGRPIPGGAFRLEPIKGEGGLPPGAGELVYRGPNVMMGYACSPSDLAKPQESDELHTGDIAVREPSGYFRIVGRMSRFAKLFGLRLSFDEIEQRLALAGIDAAVSGDDNGIIVATATADSASSLAEKLSRDLAIPASSIFVAQVSEIPRFATGKINYVAIRELRTEGPRPAASTLASSIAAVLGRGAVDESASFASLGGDSLTYIQASLAIEHCLGYTPQNWESIPLRELEQLPRRNPADMAALAENKPPLSIIGFDVARSGAILLALLAHCLGQAAVPPASTASLMLRLATPMLIILFGAMIALLHMPRAALDGAARSFEKNLAKSLQCYSLFALNVLFLWIQQPSSWKYALITLTFLGNIPYAQILSFYTVMFLLISMYVALLKRYNFWPIFVSALTIHFSFVALKSVPAPIMISGQPLVQRFLDLVVGTGSQPALAGPSLAHSVALVLAGYWVGTSARRSAEDISPRHAFLRQQAPLVAIFAAMAIWSLFIPDYPVDFKRLASMKLRNLNHPAYIFMVGGASLLLLNALLTMRVTRRVPHWFMIVGHRSLFAFGFGNALITLWPRGGLPVLSPIANAALLFAVVVAMVYAYDFCMRVGRNAGGVPGFVYNLTRSAEHAIEQLAMRIVDTFSSRRGARAISTVPQ